MKFRRKFNEKIHEKFDNSANRSTTSDVFTPKSPTIYANELNIFSMKFHRSRCVKKQIFRIFHFSLSLQCR